MNKIKPILKHISFAIAMIGAINWGLVGLFKFEIFSYLFGADSAKCNFIYILIGLCALFSATFAVIECKCEN